MKINRVKAEKNARKFNKGSFFANLYYFFELYKFVATLILGFALVAFIIVLVLDFTIPDKLEEADKSTTLKLFDQLQMANKHEEAIVLMEYKGDLLKEDPRELEYRIKLSDSYIHVGDYSKAEKVLQDAWTNAPRHLSQCKDDDIKNFLKFGTARVIYQFYERTGDTIKQKEFFDEYKASYRRCKSNIIQNNLDRLNGEMWGMKIDQLNIDELIEYDSIVVLSLSDKIKAKQEMMAYIDKIMPQPVYGVAYKMKCLNKLIGWSFEIGDLAEAYIRIAQAVDLARLLQATDQNEVLGELSDYCYAIHDVPLSKTLYMKYQEYLDDNYKDTDDEYLKNKARSFRYLENEGKWDELISNLTSYCVGMRTQISHNIPTMTEEQREYYAERFDQPYKYAIRLLQQHPDDRLARLCFDNITFKNGLLLRSNISIENSIKQLGDSLVLKEYEELKSCRRELVYQSVSGKRFFSDTDKLKKKVSKLEKDLAMKCTDFKTKNQTVENGYEQIQKGLANNEAIVDFVENEGKLLALVLQKRVGVTYVPIGDVSQIQEKLKRPIREIYHDEELTKHIWSKVAGIVNNCSNVYYVPVGIFTQIALGTLYLGEGKYLCDNKNIRLLSNPSDIIESKNLRLGNNISMVSLWGGIDYGYGGQSNTAAPHQLRSAIKRGENLVNLRYAMQEVDGISSMLNSNNIHNIVYRGDKASESAFKGRSGKGDFIIHISTHGFFNESSDMRQSMLESGLFFAGANRYWSNDTLVCEPGHEDGILRAVEISAINLSGCGIVVLSACETGLGYSSTSEGVYGLQRAFKLAGAKQVLMSLWDVDDRATSILMTEFYKNLLDGLSSDDALEKSKIEVRKQYPSPEDWGAFVLLH